MSLLEKVFHFYRMISGQVEFTWGEMLTLISEIFAEIAKLFPDGVVGLEDASAQAAILDEAACIEKLAQLEVLAVSAEPNFDITPFIPIILKLIELWLSRRGG
jgi:hypothetical protein